MAGFAPSGAWATNTPGLHLQLFVDVTQAGNTYVDATTGSILPESYIDPTTGASVPRERWTHPEVEAVLATISLCPFNPAAAPWPSNGTPPASPNKTVGRLRYLEPDPASGIQVTAKVICNDPGGCSDLLAVDSAYSSTALDAETGEPLWASVTEEDREAYDQYLPSVQVQDAE